MRTTIASPSWPSLPQAFFCLGIALLGGLLGPSEVSAADFLDRTALESSVHEIAQGRTNSVRVEKVAESLGGNPVWMIEIGTGDASARSKRPALLVVAGIEGNDLAGTSIALKWAQGLVRTNTLFGESTIYLFPRVNPDAAEYFFRKPQVERTANLRPTDDDHDGLLDEDGPDDLNNDGLITAMRVRDPEGDYLPDPVDPRLMVKADKAKGEVGVWRLLTEGRDDDKDEMWNEDGLGGVNPNRNFPFGYKFFDKESGTHPVSEVESRALADFVLAHPNIAITFTFGAADNLAQTPKSEAGGKRPPKLIQDDDLPFYKELGRLYRTTLGVKKELKDYSEPGTFSDWMYFHRGRLSLAARPWTPELAVELDKLEKEEKEKARKEEEKKDSAEKSKEPEKPKSSDAPKPDSKADDSKKSEKKTEDEDKRNEEDRAFLKWIDAKAKEKFIPWTRFEHPDFPGKSVEIGGFAPFAKSNPPGFLLEELAAKHAQFLNHLVEKLPRLKLRKSEVKHLGKGVYDVTIHVENTGYLPTSIAQGGTSREVLPTRLMVNAPPSAFLSGSRVTQFESIPGSGGWREARFVLHLPNVRTLDIEVVSELGGTFKAALPLPE